MTYKAKRLGSEPSRPVILSTDTPDGRFVNESYEGLTKREYFAAMAMQGIVDDNPLKERNESLWSHASSIASLAVLYADALLEKLSKED